MDDNFHIRDRYYAFECKRFECKHSPDAVSIVVKAKEKPTVKCDKCGDNLTFTHIQKS